MQWQLGLCNGVRIEQAVGATRGSPFVHAFEQCNAAIDHKVSDMAVLQLQFAREALGEATQPEFSYRE